MTKCLRCGKEVEIELDGYFCKGCRRFVWTTTTGVVPEIGDIITCSFCKVKSKVDTSFTHLTAELNQKGAGI